MKKASLLSAIWLVLGGCDRMDSIPYCCPEQTPESWCEIQPCAQINIASTSFTLAEPTSTALVYFLGVLTLGVALQFRRRAAGKSGRWWSVTMLLWGAATLAAGTSYQGFSYEIKCAGRDSCVWTSWWEIIYLWLEVGSLNAMLAAVAHSSVGEKWRRRLLAYGLVNGSAYFIVALIGALVPQKFLISFELMVLFTTPNVLACLIVNARRYRQQRTGLDLRLLGAWISLGVIVGAYFLYFIMGVTESLWARGVWFSANDLLHAGLILWMIYVALAVVKRVKDATD